MEMGDGNMEAVLQRADDVYATLGIKTLQLAAFGAKGQGNQKPGGQKGNKGGAKISGNGGTGSQPVPKQKSTQN